MPSLVMNVGHQVDHESPGRRIAEIKEAKLNEGSGIVSFEVGAFPLR